MPKKTAKDERIEELTQDLQRVQADFVNYKRRAEAERGETVSFAKKEVVKRILPLLANLNRGLSHKPESLQNNPWAEGVTQIAKQADDVLRSLGVERMKVVDEGFDPRLHDAVAMEDGEGDTVNGRDVVTEELQPGYIMDGEVIQHAMVKVKQGVIDKIIRKTPPIQSPVLDPSSRTDEEEDGKLALDNESQEDKEN